QSVGQVWDLVRKRAEVEIRRVDHERSPFPVSDGVSHEQTNVFPEVFAATEIDDPAGVGIIVCDHHRPRTLQKRKRIVTVLADKKTRKDAARIELDVLQVFRRILIQQELPPLRLFLRPPGKLAIRWIDDSGPSVCRLRAAPVLGALAEYSRVWSEAVASIGNR